MTGRLILVGCFLAGLPAAAAEPELRRFEFSRVEMAVQIRISLYAPDSATATRAAEAAFDRIHALNGVMSDYDDQSELRRLCATAGEGKAVPLSQDLWAVLSHAQSLAARSEGAFDVTVGPVVRLWRRARRRFELPPDDLLQEARKAVGYRMVELDPQKKTALLKTPGMMLDLGGIAKGYATEEALRVLVKAGTRRAMIEAGGDIRLGDPPPGKPGWRLGLTPLDSKEKPEAVLIAANVAVATSGDTNQFVELGGKRYSHIVDPRTGMALTDHSRVTVVAPSGMVADGLTKVLSVLGPEKGLRIIEETPGIAAMVLRAPGGKVERCESRRWKDLRIEKYP
jgi:FAD:protein FMN transferase